MEITRESLSEYFSPTFNWERITDGKYVDYAEIEICPDGINKLEENLDRCDKEKAAYTDAEWKNLHDTDSEIYESIVCYVHFDAGTDIFDKLFISVRTALNEDFLDADEILSAEEKEIIINYALELINAGRN